MRGVQVVNNFFSRWSQRKLDGDNPDSAVSQDTSNFQDESDKVNAEDKNLAADGVGTDKLATESVETTTSDENLSETEYLNDTSLEEVVEETSLAQLLASGAEAGAKKAAMRKLFLSGEFSEVDRLNDYDHDYSSVKSLTTEAASKLRNWVNEKLEEDEIAESERADANKELVSDKESDSNDKLASNAEEDNTEEESLKEVDQEASNLEKSVEPLDQEASIEVSHAGAPDVDVPKSHVLDNQ
ncbi:DUF3306 domain-containing protein [Vibrio gallaecicus]|uniref:DUF3306 domain-containing protein n=1 Tax=Vibrio gallaecicus TaxID=552386 RepID=UPI0010C9E7B7|nr:DUF3306 domain-containing protein [Vibrio gallaecicus]MDN3612875.1 DUF3306 domain-containing protein [Vibrio gallaecicus]